MSEATGSTEHSITGAFRSMEEARAAIGALEDRGVDGSRIVLLGDQAAQASTEATTARRDERFVDRISNTIAGGMLVGGLVGAALGFVAAFFAFILPEDGAMQAGGVWGFILGGAVAGSVLGFLVFGLARMKQSQAWEQSYADVSEGPARIAVRSPKRSEIDTAVTVLREHGAAEVQEQADVGVANEQTTGMPQNRGNGPAPA